MEMEEKHRTIREILFWSVLVLLLLITGYIAILATWPYTPIKVESVMVDKTQICRGQEFCFTFYGEKFYDIPANILVELSNGERYAVMSYSSNTPKGKIFKKRCFIIPYNVKPNKYQIIWTGSYIMNAFKTVHIKARSEWVDIK